ncbi:TIGR03757 family integrating conjugative element protein [Erwinia mallotivora]|uniref:Conjugal transfer protein n=1 Tax=Erwinia mallotivora TaxID=69222 RepID=A0A014N7F4_9GAMM|nr:TIGR03757 family integrating conjugative element protein [Erwinia mallotivora]EXU75323.1 conjugal transfer protein [Erwinia mallotivora]
MRLFPCLAALLFSTGVSAGKVIYTDGAHPVAADLPADVTVTLLDAPDLLQSELFGPLPADPGQAERQARAVVASPDFTKNQQALADAYAGVVHAWSLGLEKYPAVVFDDKWVVYGTTDIAVATRQLTGWRERQP